MTNKAIMDSFNRDAKEFRFALPGSGYVLKLFEHRYTGKILSASVFHDGAHAGSYYRLSKEGVEPPVWKWLRFEGVKSVPFTTIRGASARLSSACQDNPYIRYDPATESP